MCTSNYQAHKGDILRGKRDSDAVHPIVYWREKDKNFFIGIMLTKSNNYLDNILMEKTHFKNENPNGEKYEFCFNNTHLVKKEFFKKDEWGPFKKVGKLTAEGIKFIESNINNGASGDTAPEHFNNYKNTQNRPNKT